MISRNHHTIARTVGADHEPVRGEHWQARAACAGMDTEMFYPPGHHPAIDHVWDEPRAVCLDCPVRDECLADAVEHRDAWGMRGGLVPSQLDRIMQRADGAA